MSVPTHRARRLTCPSCGVAPGNRCRARGGADDGKPLAVNHADRDARGKYPVNNGRPAALTGGQIYELREKHRLGKSAAQLAQEFGVSRATVYRYLKELK